MNATDLMLLLMIMMMVVVMVVVVMVVKDASLSAMGRRLGVLASLNVKTALHESG